MFFNMLEGSSAQKARTLEGRAGGGGSPRGVVGGLGPVPAARCDGSNRPGWEILPDKIEAQRAVVQDPPPPPAGPRRPPPPPPNARGTCRLRRCTAPARRA